MRLIFRVLRLGLGGYYFPDLKYLVQTVQVIVNCHLLYIFGISPTDTLFVVNLNLQVLIATDSLKVSNNILTTWVNLNQSALEHNISMIGQCGIWRNFA